MVDYISNASNDILSNSNNVMQKQEILGIDRKVINKNPYKKVNDLDDKTEISEEARRMYERDKESQKYRKAVIEGLNNELNTSEIINLLNTKKYLNDDELAESLHKNKDFMGMLFPKNEQSA